MKGVLLAGEAVVLVHNDRDEWELPGGQLEVGETPHECVEREIAEELFIAATAVELIDTWVFEVLPEVHVLIITFGCNAELPDVLRHSAEHDRVALHQLDDLAELRLPDGYRRSVTTWAARARSDGPPATRSPKSHDRSAL